MKLGWNGLLDVVHDDLLMGILEYLAASNVLHLLAASASTGARLAEGAKAEDTALKCSTVVQRLVEKRLGQNTAFAAANAIDGQTDDNLENASNEKGYVFALRALASADPMAKALRMALQLADLRCSAMIRNFLESIFLAEVQRNMCDPKNCCSWSARRSNEGGAKLNNIVAAADAALTAILTSDQFGQFILFESAKVLREEDMALEGIYEACNPLVLYAKAARQRSGSEFLRNRIQSKGSNCSSTISEAIGGFDSAAKVLDETIQGFVDEGFNLSCGLLQRGVPYSHWWIFLGGSDAGKYGMCG